MKNLIQLATVFFLLVQITGFSQTKSTESITKKQNAKAIISSKNLKKFVGEYLLEEASFTLEIVQEKGKMYIITEFSKDLLIQKNKTTLREPTRGVDLELIKDNKNALKFTQNGYETVITKVSNKRK